MTIRVRDGKKTTHDGIKVEFVGSIGSLILASILNPRQIFISPSPKSYSMTEGIIMNSCRYLRNWQRQASCDRLKHSNLTSRT